MTHLERAVRIFKSQSALARAIGVKQGHVWYWLSKNWVPGESVIPIECAVQSKLDELLADPATNREPWMRPVTRHQLRPDLYPLEKRPAVAQG